MNEPAAYTPAHAPTARGPVHTQLTPAEYAYDRLSGGERFWWVMWNIATLGAPYLLKILIKRSIIEASFATRETGQWVN